MLIFIVVLVYIAVGLVRPDLIVKAYGTVSKGRSRYTERDVRIGSVIFLVGTAFMMWLTLGRHA